ncbi:hypothetical protein ABT288_19575 [Streptomyces sp. NPDC001093]
MAQRGLAWPPRRGDRNLADNLLDNLLDYLLLERGRLDFRRFLR